MLSVPVNIVERANTQYDKYTKIWSGPKDSNFFDVDCSIGRIIFGLMRNNPNKICQISDSDGTTLNNAEVITYSIRIAQYLRSMGLQQDDVVGIIGTNTTYLMPVVLGCMFNCTPFHVLSPQFDEDTIKHLFCITRPKVIFCDGTIYDRISAASKMVKAYIYTLKYHRKDLPKVEDLLEPTKSELYYMPESLRLGGDQTVAILCTSGTTGLPKCVCISNSELLFDYGLVTSQDVLFTFNTLDSISGMLSMIYASAHNATRIITEKSFEPDYLLYIVYKYRATVLGLTPQQISRLVKYRSTSLREHLSSVRFLSITDGNCPAPILTAAKEQLETCIISYGYALTECGGGVTNNIGLIRPNSVGKILPGIKVKILDDAGRSLGHNEIGEILVHMGKTWNGYYGNPNESKRIQDYKGWFHTGDLGYFDSDNYLHVMNRKQDMLKFHGIPYYPSEIEEVITELNDVVEACVFGLWNDVDGDAAAAAVIKLKGSKLSEQDIVEYVARRLVVMHKRLHCGVFFVEELRKTGNGKVLRNETRDMALGKKWQIQRNGFEL